MNIDSTSPMIIKFTGIFFLTYLLLGFSISSNAGVSETQDTGFGTKYYIKTEWDGNWSPGTEKAINIIFGVEQFGSGLGKIYDITMIVNIWDSGDSRVDLQRLGIEEILEPSEKRRIMNVTIEESGTYEIWAHVNFMQIDATGIGAWIFRGESILIERISLGAPGLASIDFPLSVFGFVFIISIGRIRGQSRL